MAKETQKTEEKSVEKVEKTPVSKEVLETVIKDGEKVEQKEDISAEVKKANDDFDKKFIGDGISAEKTVASEDKKPEKADKKVADEKDSGDKKVEKKVEDPAKQEEAEVISDELAERVEKAGLTEADVGRFGTVEDLEAALDVLEARKTEKVEPEKKIVEKTDVEKKAEADAKAEEDKPYDCGLNPDTYDEGLVAAVNKMGNDFKAELKSLKAENAELKGETTQLAKVHRQKAQDEATEKFDKRIADLGEDFEDVFGKGTIKEIKIESPEFKNRAALDEKISVLWQSYKLSGAKIPSNDELFQEALLILHTQKIKQKDFKPTKTKLKLRAGQAIGRGSGKIPNATAIDEASQANKDFDAKHFG